MEETPNIKKGSNVINEVKGLQLNVKDYKAADLIVPGLSLFILILLTTFVYIPMVSQATKFNAEKKSVQAKISQLTKLQSDLNSIDLTTLQTDLATSRTVIPFSLQVSDFILNVDRLAVKEHLKFKDLVAGDVSVKGNNESIVGDQIVKGVSGPLRYTGTLEGVTNFLDGLQNASPYIIGADDIKLKKSSTDSTWEVTVNITGYYINQTALVSPSIYTPFASYIQYSAFLDIFKARASTINGDDTDQSLKDITYEESVNQ